MLKRIDVLPDLSDPRGIATEGLDRIERTDLVQVIVLQELQEDSAQVLRLHKTDNLVSTERGWSASGSGEHIKPDPSPGSEPDAQRTPTCPSDTPISRDMPAVQGEPRQSGFEFQLCIGH